MLITNPKICFVQAFKYYQQQEIYHKYLCLNKILCESGESSHSITISIILKQNYLVIK